MFILSWIDSCSKVAECFSSFMRNTFYDVLRIRWDVHTGTSKKINHYTKYRVFLIIFLGVIVFSVMILGILCTQLDLWFLFLSVFVLLCLFSAFNSLGFLVPWWAQGWGTPHGHLSPDSAFSPGWGCRLNVKFGSRTSRTKVSKHLFNQRNMNSLNKLFLNNDISSKHKIMGTRGFFNLTPHCRCTGRWAPLSLT